MRLDTVRHALDQQLRSHDTHLAFLAGRDRHEALADFEHPSEAIAFLNRRGAKHDIGGTHARSAVTAAMIAEAQRGDDSTWTTLLMLAYFPGLLRIRATMKPSAGLRCEDLNALLVECFLETVSTLPLETQGRLAVVNLILGTRKSAWQHLARETARADREEPLPDAADELIGGNYPSPERLAIAREADRILQPERIRGWVQDLLRDETEDDLLLVLGTHATGKPLIDWVRDQNPDLDGAALVREYSRLRRRRSRLLQRLRDRLADSPLSQGAFRAALLLRDRDLCRLHPEGHA
jgi:hypothetical protein